jgi:hypothetical protein
MRQAKPLLFALALASLPSAALAVWTAEQDIWPAVYVDVTPQGFASFEGVVRALLPPTFPIDPSLINQQGNIDLILAGSDYSFGVDNLYVLPEIVDLSIVPDTDELVVRLDLRASINTPADPAILHFDANLSLLGLITFDVIDEDCAMNIDQAPIDLTATVYLSVAKDPRGNVLYDANGNIMLDVAFQEVDFPLPPLEQEDLNLRSAPGGSCIIDDIADIADFIGLDVVELVLQELEPTLDAQISSVLGDLETQLEDTFDMLVINTEIDLLGKPLGISAYPRDFFVSPEGLRLELGGRFDGGALPDPCVSRFDSGTSIQTIPIDDPRYPGVGASPFGVPAIGIMVNDDWLNQAAYAAWRSGLLCQEISDGASPVELPVPINTTLLNLLSGQQFAELFPTASKLVIKTRPEQPPTVKVAGQSAIDLNLDKLGVDFMAELDGRLVRAAGIDLSAAVGVDLAFDAATGNLGADIAFDPSQIEALVSFNDLLPEANTQIEGGFSALADTLVGPLLDTALQGLSFPLPSFSGIGLTTLSVGGIGSNPRPRPEYPNGWPADFLGIYGDLGSVAYGSTDPAAGCDLLGGSDPTAALACDASGRTTGRAATLGVALAIAALRRRRR